MILTWNRKKKATEVDRKCLHIPLKSVIDSTLKSNCYYILRKINFAFPYKLICKRNIHVSCYYPPEKNQIENLPTAKPKFMIFIFSSLNCCRYEKYVRPTYLKPFQIKKKKKKKFGIHVICKCNCGIYNIRKKLHAIKYFQCFQVFSLHKKNPLASYFILTTIILRKNFNFSFFTPVHLYRPWLSNLRKF